MKRAEKIAAFVSELNALCDKHDIHVTLGCGCCDGSVFARRGGHVKPHMVGSVQLGGDYRFSYSSNGGSLNESTSSDFIRTFPVEDDA